MQAETALEHPHRGVLTLHQTPHATESVPSDQELVRRAQSGDNTAFAELTRRHMPRAKRMAQSILRDPAAAEDEVQNALWKAFEHIGQFHHDARFSTWLGRIVMNECLMRLRRERRVRIVSLEDVLHAEDAAPLDVPDQADGPEEALARAEIGTVLRAEIRRIPPVLRDVFVLRDVEEVPMPEVAGRLGISVAAAKSRLLRARAELRTRLQRHCPRLGPASLMT